MSPTNPPSHSASRTPDEGELDRREHILTLLRTSAQPCTIAGIAEQMDVHPNTVRFHIDTLMRAGRVEQLTGERSGPGRPPVLYRAIRRMDPNGPTNYRLLAQILATYLTTHSDDPERSAVDIGRQWGSSMVEPQTGTKPTRASTVRAVAEVLEDLGFRPEPPSGRATQIRIRHCPFQEVVKTHGAVICELHKGLMQGVLGTLDAPVTVSRLDPFVEPDLCVARLSAPEQKSTRK